VEHGHFTFLTLGINLMPRFQHLTSQHAMKNVLLYTVDSHTV